MGDRQRGRFHGFRRTAVAAGVAGAVICAQVVMAASGAQADSAGDSGWVPGEASATAQAIQLSPSTAGLNYAIVLGTSVADYQRDLAQAESETFTGGPVVTAATSTQCDGSAPAVQKSQLPQPAIAESENGNQTSTNTVTAQYGNGSPGLPGVGTGLEQASVTTQPLAKAVSKITDFDIPGAFDVSGAQSSAFAQQIPNQLREATSTADIADLSLGNGAIELKGLHWQDTHQTGPGGTVVKQDASFSIAGLSIEGNSVPVAGDTVGQVTKIVNTALAGTGLHISIPEAGTLQDGTEVIPPLSIGIDSSALGAEVVGPLLGQAQTVRAEIDQVLEQQISCKTGTPLTVVDILLGALAGGGNLDLELGGASAISDATTYANPFANNLGVFDGGQGGAIDLGAGSDTLGTAGSFTPGSAGTPATPGSAAGGGTRALGRISRTSHCLTTSPFGHPSCGSGGLALPVGLIGLGLVIGTGVADVARARRFRRIVPEDVSTT